jgi:hypothetical protein
MVYPFLQNIPCEALRIPHLIMTAYDVVHDKKTLTYI